MDEPKPKNPQHVALGKKRWAGRPRAEMLKHMSNMGKKGGKVVMEKVRQKARVELLKDLGMTPDVQPIAKDLTNISQ